ncbi:MAG: hypothetical protein A2293_09060 [Elusimicrobia bacterium RIFOXYB2_FULL_49_7]|nr:MAG: hypothetical protein A2293_09060 [Elusimicrobia bacterium RIFOXYB2_FULL_49_7]
MNTSLDETKQLECLLQASEVLHASLEPAELFRRILDLVSDVLNCRQGRIFILDTSRNGLFLKMQKEGEARAEMLDLKMVSGDSPQRFSAEAGVPVLVEDIGKDARFVSKEKDSADSLLCVPMHFNQRLIGVIEAMHPKDGRPFNYEDLKLFQGFANICGAAVVNAGRYLDVAQENRELKEQVSGISSRLIGNSAPIRRISGLIRKVAATEVIVLITGESGTGKEIIARSIHTMSSRRDCPFLPLNCGALPETLLESELFGHEKGAFTGADKARPGIFEECQGGTVFLDEIGETSLSTQVKLLRVLQEGMIKRIGSNRELKVDARILSATNKDLKALISEKRFREDLFYRLNVVNIAVPSLRERREDIPVLAEFFLKRACEKHGKAVTGFSSKAMRLLFNHNWVGNVRELENAVESAVALCEGASIEPNDLPDTLSASQGSGGEGLFALSTLSFEAATDYFEERYFSTLLASVNGDIKVAADKAGVSEKSVLRRKSKFKL